MATTRAARKASAGGHRTRVGEERRARTRARIVAEALRVFAEKGPDAPVIDDFIRAAGVARGTFYNYLTRTEQLLVATTKSLEDDLMVAIEAEISALPDPVLRLATGVRLWLRWASTDPVWCAFIVRSRFRGPLVERQLGSDLRAGRKSGAFTFPSVEIARDLVVGTVLEAMHRMLTGRVPRSHGDNVAWTILRASASPTARSGGRWIARYRRCGHRSGEAASAPSIPPSLPSRPRCRPAASGHGTRPPPRR